jgi:host factor-I protein
MTDSSLFFASDYHEVVRQSQAFDNGRALLQLRCVNKIFIGGKFSCKRGCFQLCFFTMEAAKHEAARPIEPEFLSQALVSGISLFVGQMNKTESEGTLREIGRYEINVEIQGRLVTILKQEISHLSAPRAILDPATLRPQPLAAPTVRPQTGKPNIQEEFLDKAVVDRQLLTIHIVNGQRLKAHVEAYDNFTLLLSEGGRQHLYYKHSITTINR